MCVTLENKSGMLWQASFHSGLLEGNRASGGGMLPLTHGLPAASSSEEHLINEIIVSYIRLTLLNNLSTDISFIVSY